MANKPAARKPTSKTTADALIQGTKTTRAKKGARSGLKEGEIRVTCVMSDAQNAILHDWARTKNVTFREVCIEMADLYVQKAIKPFVDDGHRLRRRAGVEPPERYAEYYEEDNMGGIDFSKYDPR